MATQRASRVEGNPLRELQAYGQSLWLDYIRRNLITSGELKRLVEQDGLSGITSNPTIFEKAIAGSTDYDAALRVLLAADPSMEAQTLYEKLAIEDLQMVADILRPVYERSEGTHGFVSIECSPQLAYDTQATISEARRLHKALDRLNVMVKVPATAQGFPAIEALIGEGINVNITLMFTLEHYEAVVGAYLRGLERNPHPSRVSSVASFFVSRVDTMVDRALEAIGTPEAVALRGKAAVANAKRVYRRFQDIFSSTRFTALRERGARVQKPLWASTGTKNPAYSDVMYVEELIGRDTVTTVPPSTLEAFRDHGHVSASAERDEQVAEVVLARLGSLGIDLNSIGDQLVKDGVEQFSKSLDGLLSALDKKRTAMLAGEVDRQSMRLGAVQVDVEKRLAVWEQTCFSRSLWAKDYRLWSAQPVPELTDRLGWLTLPELMQEHADDLMSFAREVRDEGFQHVVLMGMGGSSLTPEVFQRTLGSAPGFPELIVLDSTHPEAVRETERRINVGRTLFLVSSKSGTTLEMLSLFRYFWQRASEQAGSPGRQFVAITDLGTPLEKLAHERGFRRCFLAVTDVGGRYSALTVFGLVPAALIGADVHDLLDRAWTMAEACASCVKMAENPGLSLGAALGELALAGYDKVTFLPSPKLDSFPAWAEQLIAESTGKNGKGIIPIADEPLGKPDSYSTDRVFVHLLAPGASEAEEARFHRLEAAGLPLIHLRMSEMGDLAREFFRWEIAIAAAGAVLGIHPFDQPDVELAKQLARKVMSQRKPGESVVDSGMVVDDTDKLTASLKNWFSAAGPHSYVGIQAYLPPSADNTASLQELRVLIRDHTRLATTLGYGPRFLHSTGQLHKGGPNTGIFLQLIDEPATDVAVPEADYTFGSLIRAQALGDYQALQEGGRHVLRINLGRDVSSGIAGLHKAVEEVLRTFPVRKS
ncbi:MAG: bifunctional transaldolase/phosoglucose isomerase [Acidobacteria bacterium]|nr:bifunctional transaldolase/phosoglucose isomerase [Acidobacteriota bacterium]